MDQGDRTRVHRAVLRGEVASSPREASYAVEFAESWSASFWGRRWFPWAIVASAVYSAGSLVVSLVTRGLQGDEALASGAAALVLALFAAHAFRRQRRVQRSLARNRLLLASDDG